RPVAAWTGGSWSWTARTTSTPTRSPTGSPPVPSSRPSMRYCRRATGLLGRGASRAFVLGGACVIVQYGRGAPTPRGNRGTIAPPARARRDQPLPLIAQAAHLVGVPARTKP